MSEIISETRLEWALRRGFVPENASELQVAIGLETMHEAPLTAIGNYALIDAVSVVEPASPEA